MRVIKYNSYNVKKSGMGKSSNTPSATADIYKTVEIKRRKWFIRIGWAVRMAECVVGYF